MVQWATFATGLQGPEGHRPSDRNIASECSSQTLLLLLFDYSNCCSLGLAWQVQDLPLLSLGY